MTRAAWWAICLVVVSVGLVVGSVSMLVLTISLMSDSGSDRAALWDWLLVWVFLLAVTVAISVYAVNLLRRCWPLSVSPEWLLMHAPWGLYGIRWDEIRRVARGREDASLYFIGTRRRLRTTGPEFWGPRRGSLLCAVLDAIERHGIEVEVVGRVWYWGHRDARLTGAEREAARKSLAGRAGQPPDGQVDGVAATGAREPPAAQDAPPGPGAGGPLFEPTPRWVHDGSPCWRYPSTPRLLAEQVVGAWVCLDRGSGAIRWQRRYHRPNEVVAVDSGVVVATELRPSDSPYIGSWGIYGVSLDDGALLWTSHGDGGWGRLLRALDFVPGFANDIRDRVVDVADGRIVTMRGRVLEVATGRTVERIGREALIARHEAALGASRAWASLLRTGERMALPGVGTLRGGTPEEPWPVVRVVDDRALRFFATDAADSVLWAFDPVAVDPSIDGRKVAIRSLPPHLYLLVSTPVLHTPLDTYFRRPGRSEIWVLAARSGALLQRLPLDGPTPAFFELFDVDERGLLVGSRDHLGDRLGLMYFERAPAAPQPHRAVAGPSARTAGAR